MAADGKCQICGCELDETWEADHVIPWSVKRETRADRMQALCGNCNRTKGCSMTSGWRPNQIELDRIVSGIIKGEDPRPNLSQRSNPKRITLDNTPGAGKSGCAVLATSKFLQHSYIRNALWVVPRVNLGIQAESSFADRMFNPLDYSLRFSRERALPLIRPPHVGAITTYQAIARRPDDFIEFMKGDSLLILDEIQFLEEEAEFVKGIVPIEHASKATLLMSGTLGRSKGRIPFIDYGKPDDKGMRYPVVDVKFSLRQAIAARAVVPTDYIYLNGEVSYGHDDVDKETELSSALRSEKGRALATYLQRDETAFALVDKCVDHWRQWQKNNYKSRLIVVAYDQKQAKKIAKHLAKKYGIESALAISDEPDAHDAIDSFRTNKRPDALVTCQMAHVGLDVPDCTHMAFLSDARTIQFVVQAFARVSRFDRKIGKSWEQQHAFVFVPDDSDMRGIVSWLRTETAQGCIDAQSEPRDPPRDPPRDRPLSTFTPKSSRPTDLSVEGLDVEIDPGEVARLEEIMSRSCAAASLPYTSLAEILKAFEEQKASPKKEDNTSRPVEEPALTPSQREKKLRSDLAGKVSKLDGIRNELTGITNWKRTNDELFKHFRKPRDQWTEIELEEAMSLVKTWTRYAEEALMKRHVDESLEIEYE